MRTFFLDDLLWTEDFTCSDSSSYQMDATQYSNESTLELSFYSSIIATVLSTLVAAIIVRATAESSEGVLDAYPSLVYANVRSALIDCSYTARTVLFVL